MKKTLTILSFIFAIFAVIFAVLPVYKFAFIPAIIGLITGIIAFIKGRKAKQSTQFIQLSLLLIITALTISIYKSIFQKTEVGDTKELEQREEKIKEDAIEELNDLDIEL